MLSDTDWSYLAGIIDGEGSILFGFTSKRRAIIPRLVIVNTDKTLIETIHNRHGGSFSTAPKPKWCKPGYRLEWGARLMPPILTGIYPYLIVKRRQADVMLKFLHLRQMPPAQRYGWLVHSRNRAKGSRIVLPEILVQEHELVTQIKELNHKGVAL